jgi:branched-chain amino acid aminotransferase
VRQLASIDGSISFADEARIPVTDEGLLRGDGVFEVIRLYAGVPFALDEHLERMTRSAARSRLPFDASALREDIRALLAQAPDEADALRLVWTRGGRRIAILERVPDFPETIALASVTYAPTRVLDGVKTLSYGANMLCSRLAREAGADEALLVTPHGRVLEAPTSSFFYVSGGRLCTPPLEDHILDSITRRRVRALADVEERPTTLDEARGAEEAFLASTFKEVLPVHAIDGVSLGAPAPGPVASEVGRLVAARIAEELAG